MTKMSATILLSYLTTMILLAHSLPARFLHTVRTPCGDATGRISHEATRPVVEFHNIPFAEPPVGDRRFIGPRVYSSKNPWPGPVDGTDNRVVKCIQGGVWGPVSGTEDCLVLTIRSTDITASKPVLVWIHGGGLTTNYCCEEGYTFGADITDLLDVVTVNINYRLGLLGFQAMKELRRVVEGEVANNGIRDIIASLRWVQENIASFGGDPDSVTIVGSSGGGTAALGVISCPLAANLFHRAVVLSPAVEMRLNFDEGAAYQEAVYDTLLRTGCQASKDTRQCLLNQPAGAFTMNSPINPAGKLGFYNFEGYFDFPSTTMDYSGFMLTDPYVVQQPPKKLSDVGFGSLPRRVTKIIMSNTLHEISYASLFHRHNVFGDYKSLNQTLERLVPGVTSSSLYDVLRFIYDKYGSLSPQMIWDTLVTDMRSTCVTNDVTEAMSRSRHHKVYRLFIEATPNHIPAFHGIDTETLFGYHFLSAFMKTDVSEFQNLRRGMVELIAIFTRDGTLPSEEFPTNTIHLQTSGKLKINSSEQPRERVCQGLKELGLLEYGWQN